MSAARGEGAPLRPGMFFTIEPMINLGGFGVKVLADGWTAVTRDRSLSAQFEHTIGVTETGVEIFTLSPAGADRAPIYDPGSREGRQEFSRAPRRTACQLHEAGAPTGAVQPQSRPEPDGGEGDAPHYHGHRERLRSRLLRGGRAAPSPTTNSSN